ncbi:unnamed protein product, partial [Darwinula stevensoni]
VWEQALSQILMSLSVGGGGLITLASYNRFQYNLIRWGATYIMNFMDYYATAPRQLFTQMVMLWAVMYCFGIENFLSALKAMTGFNPGLTLKSYLVTLYTAIIPSILVGIFIWSCSYVNPLVIAGYEYPAFARVLGWFTAFLTVSAIPFAAFYQTFWGFRHVPWRQRWRVLTTPTERFYANQLAFAKGAPLSSNDVDNRDNELQLLDVPSK